MSHLSNHIVNLMEKERFPEEAVKVFTRVLTRLDNEEAFAKKFDAIVYDYMFPQANDLDKELDRMTELAKEYGENEYTMHFVFLLSCTEELLNRYRARGISDDIYYATMDDLRCKLLECMACEEVCGTFVAGWNGGFFALTRFALGRFQFERTTFSNEGSFKTSCGIVLNDGDPLINFHIPSSGISLTDDVRLDSYKKAYEFFKDDFKGKPMVLCCSSWLLFPKHREFLPKNSNILRFMDDFELVRSEERDEFSNGWRVFAKDSDLPIAQLPENTALQRAYKQWLLGGNKAGNGYGVIVFDGEKILR